MNYEEERTRRLRKAITDLNSLAQCEMAAMNKLVDAQRKIRNQLQLLHELLDSHRPVQQPYTTGQGEEKNPDDQCS